MKIPESLSIDPECIRHLCRQPKELTVKKRLHHTRPDGARCKQMRVGYPVRT